MTFRQKRGGWHAGLARSSTERRDFAVDPLQIQQRAIVDPICDCGCGNQRAVSVWIVVTRYPSIP
jgi:hypothetical protein